MYYSTTVVQYCIGLLYCTRTVLYCLGAILIVYLNILIDLSAGVPVLQNLNSINYLLVLYQ